MTNKMRKKIFTVMAALCSVVFVNAAVDVSTYDELKAALGSGETEIRVAVGVYTIPEGDLELIIQSGTTVTGGYINNFAERIYPGAATAPTGDYMTILDGNSLVKTIPADKHRVATVAGTLEGCLIRNGHARGNGGGVYVESTGIVQNCIIKGNVAMTVPANDGLGGGAYLDGGKLISCVVAYNMANNGYGVAGNGEVINNTITANTYAPFAVEVAGGDYKHYKHWRTADTLPWDTFNENTDLDGQEITISDFNLSQTQTTTSQYAVFAAAMDLSVAENNVSFSDAGLLLSGLTDPFNGGTVGDYMKLSSAAGDVLFRESEGSGYGLQKVGNDFIYYSTRQNEAMTYVSWHGALAFSLWIGGTLPTEGQWEFAARSNGDGTVNNKMYAGSEIMNDVAWHSGNSGNRVKEVATKTANGSGIYDMSGNVWEWCADFINVTVSSGTYPDYTAGTAPFDTLVDPIWRTGSDRVSRGGSWNDANGSMSLALRSPSAPANAYHYRGFRPVLVP